MKTFEPLTVSVTRGVGSGEADGEATGSAANRSNANRPSASKRHVPRKVKKLSLLLAGRQFEKLRAANRAISLRVEL